MQHFSEKYYPTVWRFFTKTGGMMLHCRNRRNYLCSAKKVELGDSRGTTDEKSRHGDTAKKNSHGV